MKTIFLEFSFVLFIFLYVRLSAMITIQIGSHVIDSKVLVLFNSLNCYLRQVLLCFLHLFYLSITFFALHTSLS